MPGLVAEKLDPQIITKLSSRIPRGSIVITGTNGKTTTSKMLAGVIGAGRARVITNRAGSNLYRGIASTLLEHVSLNGKIKGSIGLFEVDEAAMPQVCLQVQPRQIMVLNLFRDQLDRYGELDTTAKLIGQGIAATKAEVFLNADDPLVASLKKYASGAVFYFGVDKSTTSKLDHDHTADSIHCPVSGSALSYTQNFFAHLGHYQCPDGDFNRPAPTYKVEYDNEGMSVSHKGHQSRLNINLPGLYNAYNALAAFALAEHNGLNTEFIIKQLESVQAAFGRVEEVRVGEKTLHLLLIKNPTGFNQIIQTFLVRSPHKLLIAINDNFADGRDVSWLWDAAIEDMHPGHQVQVTGIRAADMALRLKYAGIQSVLVADLEQALENELNGPAKEIYILPTYTAMLELRQLLSRRGEVEAMWRH